MIGDVLATQLVAWRRRSGSELSIAEHFGIASAITGRRDDDQRGGRGAVDERSLGEDIAAAAIGKDSHRRLKREPVVVQPSDEIQLSLPRACVVASCSRSIHVENDRRPGASAVRRTTIACAG